MASLVLRCGHAPRALHFLDALPLHGGLRCPTDASVARTWVERPSSTRVARTRPYRTGTDCCTAAHRYKRYRESPTAGLAKLPRGRETTGRSAASNSQP